MYRPPNPVRLCILWIGLALARAGLVSREHVRRTTDLAWPRIVTGLARMSKNAVDVAMVGVAVGRTAIAGVGFASPYWGVAFSLGGGFAAGTIARHPSHEKRKQHPSPPGDALVSRRGAYVPHTQRLCHLSLATADVTGMSLKRCSVTLAIPGKT